MPGYILPDKRPVIMGILNVTPDSFSDGGRFMDTDSAVRHACAMLDDGADMVDVGGESTRPGFVPVDADTELSRVVPVVRGLIRERPSACVSVDTVKASVARAALREGAAVINDVSGLADPDMASAVSEYGAVYVLMHGYAEHTGSAVRPSEYAGRIADWVYDGCGRLLEKAEKRGIPRDRIWLDPGFGFGKKNMENVELLNELPRLAGFGVPLVIGVSRKHFVSAAEGIFDRDAASVSFAAKAYSLGGKIFRVHDIKMTCAGFGLRVYSH